MVRTEPAVRSRSLSGFVVIPIEQTLGEGLPVVTSGAVVLQSCSTVASVCRGQ